MYPVVLMALARHRRRSPIGRRISPRRRAAALLAYETATLKNMNELIYEIGAALLGS